MPFSSQGHNYSPLDDTEECDTQLPLNELTDDDNDDTAAANAWPRLQLSKLGFWLSELWIKVPRPRRAVCEVGVCLVCLVAVLSTCLSLGYYTVLVHKPAPLIDKSYRAFRIPNHKASLNYGALQNARRNHTSFSHIPPTSLTWLLKGRYI